MGNTESQARDPPIAIFSKLAEPINVDELPALIVINAYRNFLLKDLVKQIKAGLTHEKDG